MQPISQSMRLSKTDNRLYVLLNLSIRLGQEPSTLSLDAGINKPKIANQTLSIYNVSIQGFPLSHTRCSLVKLDLDAVLIL